MTLALREVDVLAASRAVAVPLGRGLFAIVDEDDRDLVAGQRWYASRLGRRTYAYRRIGTGASAPHEFMHRYLFGLAKDDPRCLDHVNGNGLDNRRSNLRFATKAENGRNRGPNRNNTSGYKRVCWHKGARKWLASIQVDRLQISLGLYDDPIEAALAYDLAAIEHHGEFARPNFLRCPERRARVDTWSQS